MGAEKMLPSIKLIFYAGHFTPQNWGQQYPYPLKRSKEDIENIPLVEKEGLYVVLVFPVTNY